MPPIAVQENYRKTLLRFVTFFAIAAAAVLMTGMAAAWSPDLENEINGMEPTPNNNMGGVDLDECIRRTLQNNPKLVELREVRAGIEGDIRIDRSRFGDHVDMSASFARSDGNMQKDYYPSYHPQAVGSVGSASFSSGGSSSGSSSGSGFSSADIESLTGVSSSQISDLASQFGVDLSQFGISFKPMGEGPSTPAERVMQRRLAERVAGAPIVIDTPLGPVTVSDAQQAQIQELIRGAVIGSSSTPSGPVNAPDNRMSMRYSRRLHEWGEKSVAAEGIEENLRIANFNIEKEERETLTNLRITFFTILLKQEQIEQRRVLYRAYKKKYENINTRYEVARDVPMIDVLTAQLDMINEELRINTLENDLISLKMKLLDIMGEPLFMDFVLVGQTPNLDKFAIDGQEVTLDYVVKLTQRNSYQIAYLIEELDVENRHYNDIKRDYKPIYSAKAGFEDRRSMMGFSVNNSDNTYGLDMGVEHHVNLTTGSSTSSLLNSLTSTGSSQTNNNLYLGMSVTYLLDDNEKRRGLEIKQEKKIGEMNAQLTAQRQSEELSARQAFWDLKEAEQQLDLSKKRMDISERRLDITRKLREFGKVQEYQLDTYRNQFFSDQDKYFSAQEDVITAQENLRKLMGELGKPAY